MKDRRGQIHQAYLGHHEEEEEMPMGSGHAPAVEEGGSIGSAPIQVATAVDSKPMPAAEAPEMSPMSASSAPSAAAPQSEMMPDMAEDNAGSPAGNAGQASTAVDPSTVPSAEAPTMAPAAGGPAPTAMPVATGGGAPSNSYAGDDMGWDAMAFAEAGGYDAVLAGAMGPGICPNAGDGQDIFIFIDELNVDIVNNTLIQNTDISLIADDGSVIDIGGDFTAIQTQESLVQDGQVFAGSSGNEAPFVPQEAAMVEADAGAAMA